MILLGPIDAEHAHLSRPSHEGTWLLKASRQTCKFGGGPPDHVAQWLRACHLPKDHVWAARSKWRATFADSRSSLHCVAVGLEHVALMLDLDLLGVDAIAESLGTVLACCKLLSNKAARVIFKNLTLALLEHHWHRNQTGGNSLKGP